MSPASNELTYEQEHVHEVYNVIASHFSETRYKPWPVVDRFLRERPDGAIGIDVGCGNGKYLGVNPNIYVIGSDRSDNLINIAHERGHEALVADGLAIPHPQGRFDFAISIAVIHHFSTDVRRQEAIKTVLAALKPDGQALIFVWALEQKNSRRGWDEGGEQDVMVPWVLQEKKEKKPKQPKSGRNNDEAAEEAPENPVEGKEKEPEKVYQRYYHLFKKGELEERVLEAGGKVMESGYERDNWYAIISR